MNRLLWIRTAVMACMIAITTCAHATSDTASTRALGAWHGDMQTPSGSLALELTFTQGDNGTLSATLESVDQAPGQSIPVSRVQMENDQLKLEIAALSASYEGHFDAKKDTWLGSWQQGATLPLNWVRGPLPRLPKIDGIDGVWRGTLTRNGNELRLILRVRSSDHGTRAKLDSPDMGAAGLEVADLSREGDRVHFRVPLANVVFDGELSDKEMNLNGPWHREGQPVVIVKFARSVDSAPLSEQRPQTPRAPFDYVVEPVEFPNTKANISIAGTLTFPRGSGPFAAALLISGSGPQDRDETLFGHKPFAVLADHLTRQGIAVLRLDDRGVGKSSGDFGAATSLDFASDVRAAIAFLSSRSEIDAKAIGLIGHSEGGVIGPLAALHNPSVAYLVLLAAPGTAMPELLLSQRRMTGVLQGETKASLAAGESAMIRLYAAVSKAESRAAAKVKISLLLTPKLMRQLGADETLKPGMIDQLTSDWLRELLRYDAASTLSAINIPILALNGGLDRQVSPQVNLAAIRRATAKNADATTRQLPGLNHLFQSARSGAIAEYADIKETFAPKALQLISEWINARFGR